MMKHRKPARKLESSRLRATEFSRQHYYVREHIFQSLLAQDAHFGERIVRLLKGCRASLATDQGEAPLVGATALAHSPIAETSVDLSMRGRADDVSQTLPRPGGDPFRAARLAQQPGAPLASKLQNQGGFTQSGDKQL